MAQGTVTLYGVADAGIAYNHVSRDAQPGSPGVSATQVGLYSGGQSGSRFGLKGIEPLADGRKVGFVFEGGINITNGTMSQGGLGFGRQSTIWLEDPVAGKLEMGRRATVTFIYMNAIDPMGLAGSQATMGSSFGSANSVRYDNLVAYETPAISGFQASVGYSFNTGATALYVNSPFPNIQPASTYFSTADNQRALTAGVRYEAGPLVLALTYDQAYGAGKVQNAAGTSQGDNADQASPKAWILASTYDLKTVKFALAYGQTIGGAFFGQGPGTGSQFAMPLATVTRGAGILFDQALRTEQYLLGATIPFSNVDRLALSWQVMRPATLPTNAPATGTQNVLSVMYTYDFSRRTNLYVWGSYGDNFQMVKTARSSVFGMGVRHLF